MRLSKRIAIGVMAAALALSMTACGGDVPEQPSNSGAGGTNTSTGSNTSTDTGDKKDDTTITPPKDDSKEDNKKDEVQGETRTEKFFSGQNIVNGKQWTYTIQSQYWQNGRTWNDTIIVTSDGKRTCERRIYETDVHNQLYDPDWNFSYSIYDSKKTANQYPIKFSAMNGPLMFDYCYKNKNQSMRRALISCETGTYTMDGIVYYSEAFTYPMNGQGTATFTYCYDMGDTQGTNLRYLIVEEKIGDTVEEKKIRKVTGISSVIDTSMLQVPEGYEVCKWDEASRTYVSTGETTSKDTYPN